MTSLIDGTEGVSIGDFVFVVTEGNGVILVVSAAETDDDEDDDDGESGDGV